jgi:uncharacterized membrane protein
LAGGQLLRDVAYPLRLKRGIDMDKAAPPSPQGSERAVLRGIMDVRPSPELERTADAEDAVALGLAFAQVYAFASVDYPGAALSQIWDSNGTTAVGGFDFDPSAPGSDALPPTAFTFAGGVYQILTVQSSNKSLATSINTAGMIVGVYVDLVGQQHGFVYDAGTFHDVDFPGADATQAFGVNDAGEIVGCYFDTFLERGFVYSGGFFKPIDFPGAPVTVAFGINTAGDIVGTFFDGTSGRTRGFLRQAVNGVFTPIDFPLAGSTRAFGISDTGEIAGTYVDAAGNGRGYIYAGGNFSTVDVADARATQLTRIKNGGLVTGFYRDALK